MKVRTGICVLVMAASAAWAQAPMSTINDTRKQLNGENKPAEQRHANAPKGAGLSSSERRSGLPQATVAGKPSAKGAEQNARANSKVPATKNAAAKQTLAKSTSNAQKAGATPKQAAEAASNSGAPEAESGPEASAEKTGSRSLRGHRDPFVTVIRSQAVEDGIGCAIGKKCLDVDKMALKGIVRSQAGMIALVENQQRKTYFLRENDPVFKGHVVKINPDSVVFQQTVVDRLGKQSTKDVVKRLSTPAV